MEKSEEKIEKGSQPSLSIDGSKLKQLREDKKLTQLYVASVVGVTTDTISRWENNRYPSIRRDNAVKLAGALEVELREIVRQEEEPSPAETPAPEPEGASGHPLLFRFVMGLVGVLIVVGVVFAVGQLFFSSPVAFRWTPRYAAPGSVIPIQIKVGKVEEGSQGYLIRESLPEGWKLVDASPPPTAVSAKRIKWLITGGNRGTIISYTAQIPTDATQRSEAAVTGEIVIYSRGSGHSHDVSGNGPVTVGTYHWADLNGDMRIDDNEIMPAYYVCEAMKGLGLDWKTIEAIWSARGYRWDLSRGYQPVK